MASWDDVRRLSMALPETVEDSFAHGTRTWRVRDKTFAWERPLRRADLEALGDAAPDGPVLAVRVSDLDAKESVLAELPDVCFTTPHFKNYAAVLVRLADCGADELTGLLTAGWLARAPKRLAKEFLAAH